MYNIEYRRRVFEVKEEEKLTYAETSKRFGVGIRILFKWKKRMEPKLKRNKPATKIDMEALRKDVERYPDSYQYERAERFGVWQSSIGSALKRLNISYKKNTKSPEGGRSGTYKIPREDDSV